MEGGCSLGELLRHKSGREKWQQRGSVSDKAPWGG